MDEHHRYLTRPIRLEADELRGSLVEEIAVEKACDFAFPELRIRLDCRRMPHSYRSRAVPMPANIDRARLIMA